MRIKTDTQLLDELTLMADTLREFIASPILPLPRIARSHFRTRAGRKHKLHISRRLPR